MKDQLIRSSLCAANLNIKALSLTIPSKLLAYDDEVTEQMQNFVR